MVYSFLKGAIEEKGRPVTTKEIEDYARKVLPMCADHVLSHMVILESKGIVKRKIDPEMGGFVWWIPEEYTVEELKKMHPDLYRSSHYYRGVVEVLGDKAGDMRNVMRILFEISGGSEKRPSLEVVKRKLEEMREP